MQFDESQIRRAVETIQAATWGDIDPALVGIHDAFTRLRELSHADLRFWEEYLEGHLPDEFSISLQQVDDLSEQVRRAYVARLIESAYLLWGGGEAVDVHRASSPGELVHELNDILWLPLTSDRDEIDGCA
jgi:hypothetical protein